MICPDHFTIKVHFLNLSSFIEKVTLWSPAGQPVYGVREKFGPYPFVNSACFYGYAKAIKLPSIILVMEPFERLMVIKAVFP